ncbi:MAG: indole-3-glycerol-phosphate synthase [Desulfobacteraceae bacterium]|nr:indole-3-glycerol-phosphate synthase [Desulfobacteraceae bacterium]
MGSKDFSAQKPVYSLSESIRKKQRQGRFPVISEIKIRSQKHGDLLCGRDPAELAAKMSGCPIAGISVVTEPLHFGGSMDLLKTVSGVVGVPVLHKDFITTEDQVTESAACGASALLLITALLRGESLARLIQKARECGLQTLVETHTSDEIKRVQSLGFDLLGINNRDITVFEVDDNNVGRTESLVRLCGKSRPVVSESSIESAMDVKRAGRAGADAVLVGTAVLQAENTTDFIHELVSVGWPA